MEVTYQLTVVDFRRAIKASRKRSSFLRWAYPISQGIAIVSLGLAATRLALDRHNPALRNVTPLYILLILWSAWYFLSPYLSARSQFRGSPSASTPITFAAANDGLHFRSQKTDSKVDWSAYMNWVEEKTIFALFPHPRIFIIIPKRAFSVDQLVEFRELLRKKVKQK